MTSRDPVGEYVAAALDKKLSKDKFEQLAFKLGISPVSRDFLRQLADAYAEYKGKFNQAVAATAEREELEAKQRAVARAIPATRQDAADIAVESEKIKARLAEVRVTIATGDTWARYLRWLETYSPQVCDAEPRRAVDGITPPGVLPEFLREHGCDEYRPNSWAGIGLTAEPERPKRLVNAE